MQIDLHMLVCLFYPSVDLIFDIIKPRVLIMILYTLTECIMSFLGASDVMVRYRAYLEYNS